MAVGISNVAFTSIKGTNKIAPNESFTAAFTLTRTSSEKIASIRCSAGFWINNRWYTISNVVSIATNFGSNTSLNCTVQMRSVRNGESCTSPLPGQAAYNMFDWLKSYPMRSFSSISIRVVTYSSSSVMIWDRDTGSEGSTALRERINPSFTSFSFQRCDANGTRNNEGERLLSNIKIAFANNAYSEFTLTLQLYSVTGSSQTLVTTVTIPSSDSRMTQLITGISNSTLFVSSFTVAKGTSYVLKGTLSSSLESGSASCSIAKAFVNMHLSAATNGGVAFGSFSTSSNASPKFENNYPAYFYNAMTVSGTFTASGAAYIGGDLTVTGALILRGSMSNFKGGYYSAGNVAAGGDVTKNIGFGATFKSTPFTQISLYGDSNLSKISIQITAVSTSSMNVRIINSGSADHNVTIAWMAFGILS